MLKGWSKLLLALSSLVVILSLAPSAQAGICSSNGIASGGDCVFATDPGYLYGCREGPLTYNCNGYPSKYQNGCIGYDYYDFSGSYAYLNIVKTGPNTCTHNGDFCQATIYRNDPRCGYTAPTQPASTYTPPSTTGYTPVQTYNYQYPWCGNSICEYGEDLFNCPMDCGLYVPWPPLPISFCGNFICEYPYENQYTCGFDCGLFNTYPPYPTTTPPVVTVQPPAPTPRPPSPTCSVSNNPSSLIRNGTSTVTVTYKNFQGTPSGNVVCGDGQVVSTSCSGTNSGSCTASCTYSQPARLPAHYVVQSNLDGVTCASGGVTLQKSNEPGRLLVTVINQTSDPISSATVTANGKTQMTNASGQTSFTLKAGTYLAKASKPNHGSAQANAEVLSEETTELTLQLERQYSTLCRVTASPSTLRGGTSSTITVNYNDARQVPSNLVVSCGNGQTAAATCTGTPTQGTCTATCNYAAEKPYPRTHTATASVDGQTCSSASVQVVEPLPDTGTFVGRISACTDGRLISNAELRVSQPQFMVPTNFTGDGVNVMTAGQTVRLNNGFIVRVDSVQAASATISFLNAQGQLIQQNTVNNQSTVAISQATAELENVFGGTTAQLEVRSLTSGTPFSQTNFFTNEFGQVTASLTPGTYTVDVFKDGFNLTRATFTILQAETTTQSICLEPRTCDFAVEMVSAPTCQYNSDQYQLRIRNTVNQTKNVTLSYSTNEIQGPSVVPLGPQESTVVNLKAKMASPAVSGQTLGIVNVRGPDACTQSFTLPLCIAQEITVQAAEERVSTVPGKSVCSTVLVKNRALENVRVVLSGNPSTPSFRFTLSPQTFMLTALQVKNIELCSTPSTGTSGATTLEVRADSAFGQANDTVVIDTRGQTFYSTDFAGCPIIDADRVTHYNLNVQNSGQDGDFVLEVQDNDVTAQDQYVLQQFQQGETRPVTLTLEPRGARAGRHFFDVFLKEQGQTVFQDQLCFEVRGTSVAQAVLSPNPLDVPKGQTRSAFLSVRNLGSLKAEYILAADNTPLTVRLEPDRFVLSPAEEQVVSVQVTAAETLTQKTYSVPIKVSAKTTLTTADETYSVEVNCGDGGKKTITCPAGTGSCTATCTYGTATGFFTPSATVAGRTCTTTSATVEVIPSRTNTCVLHASPNNVNQGSAVTVTASYNTLATTLNGTLQMDCGNGRTVTAQNCNGATGSCSATCDYPSIGDYAVTASQGGTTCRPARVAVSNPSDVACKLSSSPNTVLTGESATVHVRYFNLPVTGTTSSSLSVPVFVDSDNLLVNVLDTSNTITLTSAELTLSPVPPQQVFPGTSLNLPVRVRNDNYFTVENILVYADSVPQGMIAKPANRFSLAPGQERTVTLQLEATPATPTGTYVLDIIAESPSTLAAKQKVPVTVLASAAQQLNIDVQATQINLKVESNASRFVIDATITNLEPVALSLTPSIVMDENWAYAFQPQVISLAPQGQGQIQGQITPTALEPGKKYPATLRIRASDGRVKDVPLELSDQGGSILGGLVTFGEISFGDFTVSLLLLVLLLLLLAAALFLLAAGNRFGSRGG
ncbi:hypothetical protein HY572_01065 [Candidatus Micrarchaeota archaeon]|nr:hypothetical protein [Candidatus Micrarchaeota archaeon]